MHFLLWTEGSRESTNFDTSKCSDQYLPNSSCHFPNYKSVFLQILHEASVSWKITPLYFFRSKVIYFVRKGPIKAQIFETFECLDENSPKCCHFWNNKSVFLQTLHHFWVSWDITPLYVFSWNFIYFQRKELIKVQIITWAVESLKFCSLMSSFCNNHIKFQLKKYRRVIFHDIEEWCKILKKTDLWFQIWHKKFGEFSPNYSNNPKISLRCAIFVRSIWGLSKKKYRETHSTEQWCKIWRNPYFVVSKMVWGIGWTFIKALKSLKNCTMMGSFCPKHIMFQLQDFRGIMGHDTERWCKI